MLFNQSETSTLVCFFNCLLLHIKLLWQGGWMLHAMSWISQAPPCASAHSPLQLNSLTPIPDPHPCSISPHLQTLKPWLAAATAPQAGAALGPGRCAMECRSDTPCWSCLRPMGSRSWVCCGASGKGVCSSTSASRCGTRPSPATDVCWLPAVISSGQSLIDACRYLFRYSDICGLPY